MGNNPQGGVAVLSVRDAARVLLVSPARVRLLLNQGRIAGHRNAENGRWMVRYPFVLSRGSRGPQLRYRWPWQGLGRVRRGAVDAMQARTPVRDVRRTDVRAGPAPF